MDKMFLEGVTFSYGTAPVVKDLNLRLKSSMFYGIVGPNGAGKSTLLKLLNRYLEPQQGSIVLKGKPLKNYRLPDLAREIAFIPQTSVYFPFTVEEVVLLGRTPYYSRLGKPSTTDLQIVEQCLMATEIVHLAQRSVNDLSGGERQRVTIARALAQQTDLLLFDEPTTHLDLEHQIKTCQLLQEQAEKGKTAVAVLHDLNLVANYCDYVFILHEGILVQEGTPDNVFSPELIQKIYNVSVPPLQHPITGRPLIIP